MFRKLGYILIISAIFLSFVIVSNGVVDAAGASIMLSPGYGPATTTVNVSGTGFGANEAVRISFGGTFLVQVTADGSGAFTTSFQVPSTAQTGPHVVSARGRTSGSVATATFRVLTDWAQYRFVPQHLGMNPYENLLTSSNVAQLKLAWAALPVSSIIISSPAVATVTLNGVPTSVAYIGAQDGNLHAFNARTGVHLWSAPCGQYASPAVINGVVYSACSFLYAFDASTGAQLWKSQLGFNGQFYASPTVVNGVVYIGETNGLFGAFDAKTGALLWSYQIPTGAPIYSSAAVANGIVYFGSFDHNLYALDASTGTVLWTATTGNVIRKSSPAVANGFVYVGSDDDHLYAFDASTGAQLWSAATGGAIASSPAVANGFVYVGSDDDHLYAFDANNGTQLWSAATSSIIEDGPAVANGVVYVGGGSLYAFDASIGTQLWSFSSTQAVYSSPIVVNGRVYEGAIAKMCTLCAFALPGH